MTFSFKVVLFVEPEIVKGLSYREVRIAKDARFKAVDAFWDALVTGGFAVSNTVVAEMGRAARVDRYGRDLPDFDRIAKDTLEEHEGWAHLEPGVLAYELAMAYEAGQQHCACPPIGQHALFETTHRLCIDAYSKLWRAFNELQEQCAGAYVLTRLPLLQSAGAKARTTLDEAKRFVLHDSVAAGEGPTCGATRKSWMEYVGMEYVCVNPTGHAGCAAGVHSWRLRGPEPATGVGGGPAHRQDAQMAEALSHDEEVPADDPDREDNPAIRAMRWRTRALAVQAENVSLRAAAQASVGAYEQAWRAGVSDALDAIDEGGSNTRSHAYHTIEKLLQRGGTTMSEFKQYHRKQIAELRPYVEGEELPASVSVSDEDKKAGSPKAGDMIARNPKNHDDQWLVAAKYFADNFEPVT